MRRVQEALNEAGIEYEKVIEPTATRSLSYTRARGRS